MKIDKKTIIIISIILLALVAFLGIKNNKKEDSGKINVKGNNVKIVANEMSKIELEEYKNDALTMKKPKDWKVTSAGTGMYYAISVYDEKNPIGCSAVWRFRIDVCFCPAGGRTSVRLLTGREVYQE